MLFRSEHRDENFANGRSVRNFFEKVMINQANRLAALDDLSDEQLETLEEQDLPLDFGQSEKEEDPILEATNAYRASLKELSRLAGESEDKSESDADDSTLEQEAASERTDASVINDLVQDEKSDEKTDEHSDSAADTLPALPKGDEDHA